MDNINFTNTFAQLFEAGYREGKGHCGPTNPNHHFDVQIQEVKANSSSMGDKAAVDSDISGLDKPETMVFGHPVIDYINALLPNGAPVGSRHPWMVKLAKDLLIICDNDTKIVKSILLSLKWVNDVVTERRMSELDEVIESGQNYNHKRESENFYPLQPSIEMRRAIEQVTNRKYRELVKEYFQTQGALVMDQDDMTRILERLGDDIKKLFPKYPLLKLLCHRLKRKHYIAALFVGGAFGMTLMTRCWYSFWSAPGRKCRLNSNLILIGRSGSGKHIAVDLYDLMMEPVACSDQKQVDALNNWNQEHDQKNGASKNSTTRPNGVYRRLPSETSDAAIREAQFNAKEIVDGEEMPLHLSIFDSELDNTLRQMKKTYMEAMFTFWLKGFHNEPHGSFLKTSSAIVGEYRVHLNCVYTGTQDALDKLATKPNFINGLLFRLTAVPMGSTNFEMMEAHKYNEEDAKRDALIIEWARKLDATKGEVPIEMISDALFQWTKRRMSEAEENDSFTDEDMIKRPCWHAINYAIPFIVARHWDQMVEDNGRWKCGVGFKVDKTDVKLALLIVNAHYAFQKYFFGHLGEDYYENESIQAASKTHRQSKTLLAYKRLPEYFTSEDVKKEFGYDNIGSVCSCLKRLQDDGLAQKVRNGENKGKYRKLS